MQHLRRVLRTIISNLLNSLTANLRRRLQRKLTGIEIPKITPLCIAQNASVDAVCEESVAVANFFPIPVSVRLFRVCDSPEPSANLGHGSRILTFVFVIHVQTCVRREIRVTAARVKNLIQTPDKVTNIQAVPFRNRIPLVRLRY